jgi:hypothetical protein
VERKERTTRGGADLESGVGVEEELAEEGMHDHGVDDESRLHVLVARPRPGVDL